MFTRFLLHSPLLSKERRIEEIISSHSSLRVTGFLYLLNSASKTAPQNSTGLKRGIETAQVSLILTAVLIRSWGKIIVWETKKEETFYTRRGQAEEHVKHSLSPSARTGPIWLFSQSQMRITSLSSQHVFYLMQFTELHFPWHTP